VSLSVSKEQILAKMQEFDVALQTAVNVRTELWSMIANLPESKRFTDIEIPLTFYDKGHVIAWGNDSEHFSPSTFRLLRQLWIAPDRTLSKDEVRESVNEDEEASNEAVWACLKRARQELEAVDFPYEIETL
jgi:DNA-binding response OmpR family regulator